MGSQAVDGIGLEGRRGRSFANLICVNAEAGASGWQFQTVHGSAGMPMRRLLGLLLFGVCLSISAAASADMCAEKCDERRASLQTTNVDAWASCLCPGGTEWDGSICAPVE